MEGLTVSYIEYDYAVDVVCDHRRNDPNSTDLPRVVCRILHYVGRIGIGTMVWREAVLDDDPEYPPALQTYYGEAVRLGTMWEPLHPADKVPGMTEGERWRFWCSDCDDTVPIRGSILEPKLEALRHAGVPSVSLAFLAAIV